MNLKRAFDVSASAIGITLLAPVLAALSLGGLVHFRGNPFHAVDRIGKDGKIFRMMKFKTMRDDETNTKDEDERITPYGHVLRATSLDELPQLMNIFKGEMSFVGPRPRSPVTHGHDAIPDTHKDILSVKPGLTGPWQLAAIGRKTALSKEERLDLDASYVRQNPTVGKDIAMILKTLPTIIKGHDGEYLGKSRQPPNHPPKMDSQ